MAATLPSTLYAQDVNDEPQSPASESTASGIGDIVVTARRREENLQTVPIAVTAVTEEVLTRNGSFSPLDIGQVVPGIRTSGTVGNRSDIAYSIRGQSVAVGNIFPSVIPYFAEIPILSEFSTGSFFDLENVQVLRGPQGVRFGRVTDGGAVLLVPKKPTDTLGGYLKATVGDYDLHTIEAAINLPIVSDHVLLRVSGERARRGGFTLNVLNGQKLDDVHYDTIRASLTLRPIDAVENTTVFQYNEAHESGGNAFAAFRPSKFTGAELAALTQALAWQIANGPRRVQNGNSLLGGDYGIFNNRTQTILSNTTKVYITDDITLRNIFGYVHTKKFTGFDYDGSPYSLTDSYNYYVPRVDLEHISDEVQLSGNSFNLLEWTLGAYFDRQKPGGPNEQVQFLRPTTFGSGIYRTSSTFSLQTTKSTAFYGQGEFTVAPGIKLSAGARYTHDSNVTIAPNSRIVNYNIPAPPGAPTFVDPNFVHGACNPAQPCITLSGAFNVFTYELGASYEVNSDVFTYITYRKGYRPGGFNTFLSSISPTGAYSPEYDKSLEVGLKIKSTIGSAPFRVNIAGFYDRYTNIQKRINLIDNGTPLVLLLNVTTPATVKGIEFEGNINPIDGLDLAYNFAVTDAKYSTEGLDPAVLNNPATGACNNTAPRNLGFCPYNPFALTPKFQMTASIGYTLPLPRTIGDVRMGFDLYHQSSMAFTDSAYLTPDSISPGYWVLNGNITWKQIGGENLDLSVFVSNITDEVYWQGAQSVTQAASTGSGGHFYAPPRMFGVSATMHFGN